MGLRVHLISREEKEADLRVRLFIWGELIGARHRLTSTPLKNRSVGESCPGELIPAAWAAHHDFYWIPVRPSEVRRALSRC